MTIHVEHLSLEELNTRVVRRIQELHGRKTQKELESFKMGDRVSFQSDGRMVEGLVVRVNRKTLSVRTGETSWTLHPRFVTKLPEPARVSSQRQEGTAPSRWN